MSPVSGPLTPDKQLAVLTRIWGQDGEGGFVFLPWIPGWCRNKEERRRNWNEGPAFEWPQDRDKILAHIADHQADDLYFSVNVFLQDSRIIQHIGESRVLYADLDEVDPRSDIDPQMKPTIAWESSPGRFQAVWAMSSMEWEASMPGGLNHRLTAAIGADPSGWDATQVLRVPGKANYKFDYKDEEGTPAPGRLLWAGQKTFKWSFFESRLPEVKTYDTGQDVEESEVSAIDRHEVWARVRMKCSHTVRNFMAMRARDIDSDEFDRSEVLWQIERDLADAGCTVAEIIAIVRHTPWNKYDGRRNELAQLRAEALKALGVAEEQQDEEKPLEQAVFDGSRPTLDNLPTLAMLSEASIPRPNWLVRKIWTRGSVGFIAGEPKSYKSYFALDMAISLATGTAFLNDPQFACRESRVIYIQEEDALPLVFHRADQIIEGKLPERHWHGQITLGASSHEGASSTRSGTIPELIWTPPTPIDTLAMLVRKGFVASDPAWQSWLAEIVSEWGADMVIIDTLGTTNGGVDINDSVQLNKQILNPLRTISEHTGSAIAFVHHNKKGETGKARSGQQMLGSTALHAWVESALYVQSKEQLTGQPATVKVDRENKLAEDMKLTVKIPTMTRVYGDSEAERIVWSPDVSEGWSESTQGEPIREEFKAGRQAAGGKLAEWIRDEHGLSWYSIDHLAGLHSQNRRSFDQQLNRAISNGLIVRDNDRVRYNSDFD